MKRAKVTRPEYGKGDIDVTLTATVSHGTVSKEYILNATVLEAELPDDLAVNKDLSWITLPNSTHQDITLPFDGPNNTRIAWTSSDRNLTADGKITRPYNDDGDYTAKITATVTKGLASATKEFTVIIEKLTVQEEVDQIAASITWDDIRGQNYLESAVTQTLNLFTTVPHGATIWWGVQTTAWINTITGEITRPDSATGDSGDTLTAVIRKVDADGNGHVAYANFNLTIKAMETPVIGLMQMFAATSPTDPGYVDPATISTDGYWTADNGAENWIDDEYWAGRNKILQKYNTDFGTTQYTFLNSYKTSISAHDKHKFKLMQDRRKGVDTTDFPRSFTLFWNNCTKSVDDGGYGVSIERWKAMEIYLTYWLKTVVNICIPVANTSSTSPWSPDWITDVDLTSLVDIVVFKPEPYNCLKYVTTLDWVDFSDVANVGEVLGFDTDPLNTKTKSFMTIEPSVFTMPFDENVWMYKPLVGAVTGDGTSKVGSVTYDMKKVPDTWKYVNVPNQRNWRLPCTFIHELGHSMDYDTITATNAEKLSHSANFRNMSGWDNSVSPTTFVLPATTISKWACDVDWTTGEKEPPVSLYGASLLEEDFAEMFRMWFTNEDGLIEYWPRRYNFMKCLMSGSTYAPLN
jgi:hypothetical protein